MLTQTAKYAIRALLYLADVETPGYSQTRDIAERTNVPPNYLGKTLQKLAHARVLDSQKGLHGGFRMARPPERVTLYEVLVAIESIPRDLAEDSVGDAELPSAVYAKFAQLSLMYNEFLKNTTLADLMPVKAMAEEKVESQSVN